MNELIPKIEDILNCYGFSFSHHISGWDNHFFKNDGPIYIVFDIKEFNLTGYKTIDRLKTDVLFYLEGEHLTLNSVCNFLSKL